MNLRAMSITQLAAFSMIKKSADGNEQCLSLHRVVHDITWRRVAEDQRATFLEIATELFAATAPHEADRYENWRAWHELFPHANSIWKMLEQQPRKHWNIKMLHGMALYHLGQYNHNAGERLQQLTYPGCFINRFARPRRPV